MKLQMSFGENLINLRKQKGWSQDDLADNLNLSRQAISKWENDTSKPDIDNIKKISKIFSVTIDDLLNNDVVKDKAVTLNVKKQEKKERAINIVKCMIIAVIILYIINVIFKFVSLLIIVNGVQKYANLSNYHYVITTYDENGLSEIEECWFKDGICKTIITNIENSVEINKQEKYYDSIKNYGIIKNNGQIFQLKMSEYLNFNIESQLYSAFPIELRNNEFPFLIYESLYMAISTSKEEIITFKIKNKIIGIQKDTMLPQYIYDYNKNIGNYVIKFYTIELNKVDKIEI